MLPENRLLFIMIQRVTPDTGVLDFLLLPFLFQILFSRETELGGVLQEPQE